MDYSTFVVEKNEDYNALFDRLGTAVDGSSGDLVLDLGGLDTIDDVIMGCFLNVHNRMKNKDASLVLVKANNLVYNMLSIVSITKLIPCYDTVKDYEKSLDQKSVL